MDFFSFNDLPEEIQKAIKEQHDRRLMEIESRGHDLNRLFDELSEEHLLTLRTMLNAIVSNTGEQSRVAAAYFDGQAVGSLRVRFNICPSCGVDHSKEAEEHLSSDRPFQFGDVFILTGEEVKEYKRFLEIQGMKPTDESDPNQTTVDDQIKEANLENSNNVVELMKKYRVVPIAPPDIALPLTENTPVKCVDCNKDYVSLKDRILRGPDVDGCDGCVDKAKWG